MTDNKIKIMIALTSRHPMKEVRDWAYVEDTVNKNWVSKEVVHHLQLKPTPTKTEVAETWRDLQLRSTGIVGFSWSRRDVSTPISYLAVFHVTEEETPHIIIGNELSSKEDSIRNPKDNIHVLQASKQNEAQKAEEKRRAADNAKRIAERDEWEKAQEAARSQQNRSSQAGPSSGTGSSSTSNTSTGNRSTGNRA
ncbi:hypothetical protein MMC30_007643 [Trapelia coarctata]|nr:hypothetical protein [Trapelia coarctata]